MLVRPHSQASNPLDYAAALTWNYHFLITELIDPTQLRITSFARSVYVAQFQHMKLMMDAGADTTYFRKSLGLLCKPNVQMLDVESGSFYSGPDVFVFLMNPYYRAGAWAVDGPSHALNSSQIHLFNIFRLLQSECFSLLFLVLSTILVS